MAAPCIAELWAGAETPHPWPNVHAEGQQACALRPSPQLLTCPLFLVSRMSLCFSVIREVTEEELDDSTP